MIRPTQPRRLGVVLTCEHASNAVPARYRPLFKGAAAQLRSHRGWDPGALVMARRLSRRLDLPVLAGRVTRLLVDLNRTRDDRGRFSSFSSTMSEPDRIRVLETYYDPHWQSVDAAIRAAFHRRGALVLHLACHSFTPQLDGRAREYEIGLLFDPRRAAEAWVATRWRARMKSRHPELRIRHNLPYRGWTDGMTTEMRRRFGPRYLGLELECNQAVLADDARAKSLELVVGAALTDLLDTGLPSSLAT